ncbi:MAG: gliding motility-associated C-terminal domain-containing protein [Bacteroidales bacterium]|nr:gliding motility-associated C-terminal domain-containing protein [Bacteroidales bacterium]
MKPKQFLWLIFTAIAVNASAFTVSKNAVMTIGKQTQVKLSNVDLINYGTLIADTASLLIISNTREQKISGDNIYLYSMKIDGQVKSDVEILSLSGDLTMQSGVLNIGTNQLVIDGDLLDEKETAYVTASTGTIEKRMDYLPAMRPINVLGLEFTALNDVYHLRIIRSHSSITRPIRTGTTKSAMRVYEFESMVDITAVDKQTLPHEFENMYKPTVFVHDYDDWKKAKNKHDEFYAVSKVSTFSPDPLHFPKVITPDGETHRTFEIGGLDEYPNSRLIILSRTGQQLYDFQPYQNDFTGKDLPDGTYYFVFSEEPDSPASKRSFFEIVR